MIFRCTGRPQGDSARRHGCNQRPAKLITAPIRRRLTAVTALGCLPRLGAASRTPSPVRVVHGICSSSRRMSPLVRSLGGPDLSVGASAARRWLVFRRHHHRTTFIGAKIADTAKAHLSPWHSLRKRETLVSLAEQWPNTLVRSSAGGILGVLAHFLDPSPAARAASMWVVSFWLRNVVTACRWCCNTWAHAPDRCARPDRWSRRSAPSAMTSTARCFIRFQDLFDEIGRPRVKLEKTRRQASRGGLSYGCTEPAVVVGVRRRLRGILAHRTTVGRKSTGPGGPE